MRVWLPTERRHALAILLLGLLLLLAAAQAAQGESYEQAVEGTAGLAHFWPMGEASGATSFADVVGGATAEVSGGVTLGEPGGLVGDSSTSALFNGSTGAAHASVDLSGTHELTVEFWMKWDTYGADDHLALEFTPNFNEYPGGFLVDPDATPGSDFAVSVGRGSTANTVFFERPSAGQWHYYAFVIDTEAPAESEITPYVDGKALAYTKSASDSGAGNFANSTLFWMSRDASTLFGAGQMQDLALYESALSAGTIARHYELGEGGPKASFTSTPLTATAGVPVHLDGSGSSSPAGTITDYAWDFNGSKEYGTDTGGSPMVSHTFSTPGTYTVDLRVKDSEGLTGTTSQTITVAAALPAYEQAVESTSGLAHFWPMGESSGESFADIFAGANATLSGGVTLGEPGGLSEEPGAHGALFNGSTGAAHASVNLSGTHELTVEFWMKWNSYAADDHLALEFTPNFNEYTGGFLVDPDATPGSDFAVSVGKGSTANTVFFERPSAGQWHYYAFVINTDAPAESEITPYVDGKSVSYTKSASDSGAGNFANSTLFWFSRDASTLFGAGEMQDLALYEGALSKSTIVHHYELGAGGPKAAFTSTPVAATAGVPVHLDASASSSPAGPIADYAWDFNGSKDYATNAGESATTTHTFSTPGTYTVDLRVTDGEGTTATISHTITVAAALPAYEQAVEETRGLAHFWPMGESSGSSFADVFAGANATLAGGVTLDEPGGLPADTAAHAALFDGSSGAAHASLNLSNTHELTVEFWMKWNSYAADDHLALEFTPNFNEHPGGFLVDPDATPGSDFAVSIGEGSSRNTVFFERPTADTWHYYAFTINTSAPAEAQIAPYVDGKAVSYTKTESGTGAGNFADSTLYWFSRDASTLFGAGSMQDLAIYESTLSADAIQRHYELGVDGSGSACTDTWTGAAGDHSWATADNWSTEAVPTSSDVACIGSGATVNVEAGSKAVGRLQDEGSLTVSGGTLEIGDAIAPSTVASLTVNGGTLAGSGDVDVSEALAWTEGTMSGSGKTILQTGASSLVDPTSSVTLSERELVNEGTLTWKSGAIVVSDGGKITNSAKFYANDNGPHCEWGCLGTGIDKESGSASFENANSGEVIEEAGSLTTIAIPFDNQGSVQALSGELRFTAGGVAGETANGSWAAASSDLIEFDGGSYALGAYVELAGEIAAIDTTVSASGLQAEGAQISLEGAALNLEGPIPSQLQSLSIGKGPSGKAYSTLTGSGETEIDVAKSFEWSEGAIRGNASLILESGVSATINPVSDDILDKTILVNKGTLNWYSGRLVGAGGAELLNEGTFDTDDQGPADECAGSCTGYHTGMLTAAKLLETFGEYYFFGETSGGEVETFAGGASLINEGEIADPEVSCPPDKVEVQWPTTGNGSFNDPCTAYTSLITPASHEPPEEEEEGTEAVPHPGVGTSTPEGEDCHLSSEEEGHCYAVVESVNVEPPAGFLGSSVEIDPTCLATNGDNENFADAEQWVAFTTRSQYADEHVDDWTEAGVTVGESETFTWPHYFVGEVRALGGYPTYIQHNDEDAVSLDQYFQDSIWYINGSQWEAWVGGYHRISSPQPEVAKHLEAGTEDTANDVSAEAKLRNIEYETTKKGTWRKGWTAEHKEMKEVVVPLPPHNSGLAKVTSPTTAEVSFDSAACL